jgi:hypothetical protein
VASREARGPSRLVSILTRRQEGEHSPGAASIAGAASPVITDGVTAALRAHQPDLPMSGRLARY